MKCELYYDDQGWQFLIEPETEVERCAFEYLATRPRGQVTVLNTRLGRFTREKDED
jgi:hypothetical protein